MNTTGLNHLDLIIIAIYLVGITLFGLRFRKKQRSLRDYFLADRNIPWWAIALSIVAAETSTLTIISIPGLAYDSNLGFLQVVLGYLVARVIISILFIPHYFRGEMFTAYQLIERRFGPRLRSLTAGLFLLTRAAAEGVRIFAVSIVVGIAIGTGDIASIAIITVLTLIYTFEGGMAAAICTTSVARSWDFSRCCILCRVAGARFTMSLPPPANSASSIFRRSSLRPIPSGRDLLAGRF